MFKDQAAEFIYKRTYSRWREQDNRRENWDETVDRVIDFLKEEREDLLPAYIFTKLRKAILSQEVLPSMRLMWSAGEAARKDNTCLYNCAFLSIKRVSDFGETLYVLMCGTGVGFSVDKVHLLPAIPIFNSVSMQRFTHQVEDSKLGWKKSLDFLIQTLYEGNSVDFDYSLIRPQGSRLKTMGGRASGPLPLIKLHNFCKEIFGLAQGRKLTSLEVHDLLCEIAEVVVVGGVRRSSLISLSPLKDREMQESKNWPFPIRRAMANNSAIYETKPSVTDFMDEWKNLILSKSGERGIFNLEAARKTAPERRNKELIEGTNPCGEISLRDKQFCNLTTVIIRPEDDMLSLQKKVELATILGTIQSSFTYFPNLSLHWKKNTKEEALLGVSLCGQMDNQPLLNDPKFLSLLKKTAIKTNKKWSKILGINPSVAITTGKPDGTTSQITTSGSGCHPWFAPYFIRRYRISRKDPLVNLLLHQGLSLSPENGQEASTASTLVVSFPVKAPEGAITRSQVSALSQLEWYRLIKENYCEHNQSITVYVKDEEWLEVGNWVYKNWNVVNGVSFLPYDNGSYEQAPYEEISKETYDKWVKDFPKIDYSLLPLFETQDEGEGNKTLACIGDKCEIT